MHCRSAVSKYLLLLLLRFSSQTAKKKKEFYVKKKGLEFRENSMTVHVIGRFAFSSTFRYFSRKLSRIYLKSKDMHFLKNGLNLQSYIPTTSFFVTIATYRNSLKIHFRGN